MERLEQYKPYDEDGPQAAEPPGTEPDPDYVCEMLAWIGTDLVECLEEDGQSCKYAHLSDDLTVFCECQARKYMAQILHR